MATIKRYTPGAVELREQGDGPSKGYGHFLVFNQETELWPGFREKIALGALDNVLDNDVAVLTNHDTNLIMARTAAGNAWIGQDETGGTVEWIFPDTTAGRDTKENMRIGNITGMSFGFTVKDDKLERNRETGEVTRTILKLERLYDASPVAFPAYTQTDTQLRAEYRAEIEARPDWPVEEREENDKQPTELQSHSDKVIDKMNVDPNDDLAVKIEIEQKKCKLKILSH